VWHESFYPQGARTCPHKEAGADISEQEADDLLHKLITESTKVQAAFAGAIAGLAFLLTGILKVSPGLVWVTAGDTLAAPHISFDPTPAVERVELGTSENNKEKQPASYGLTGCSRWTVWD
jgi:hypothetical protein